MLWSDHLFSLEMSCLSPGLQGRFSRLQPRCVVPSALLLSRCASHAVPATISPKLSADFLLCIYTGTEVSSPSSFLLVPMQLVICQRDSLAQSPVNAVPCPENAMCPLVPTCSDLHLVVLKNNMFCGAQLPIAFQIALHPLCLSGFLRSIQSI